MVDQREAVVGVELDGVAREQVDPDEVDERAILLMANLAVIEDIGVDPAGLGDRLERDRARDRVRARVVVREDREPVFRTVEDVGEATGLVFEFASFERPERGVGDHLRGVDDGVRARLAEFVGRHGVRRPGDDELLAAVVADVLNRGAVRLDVRREDQEDVAVGDRLGDRLVADVRGLGVQVLVTKRLDAAVVDVDDEDVLALVHEVLGDGVADAPTAEDRVGRHRGHRDAGAHCLSRL